MALEDFSKISAVYESFIIAIKSRYHSVFSNLRRGESRLSQNRIENTPSISPKLALPVQYLN
jgi:hypothetical protein